MDLSAHAKHGYSNSNLRKSGPREWSRWDASDMDEKAKSRVSGSERVNLRIKLWLPAFLLF